MAYAWMFAIFPLFIFLLTLLPYIPESQKGAAQAQIRAAVHEMPPEAAEQVWGWLEPRLKSVLSGAPRGIFTISILLTLWAASGGMLMTMRALDRCYNVEQGRTFLRERITAVVLTALVSSLVIATLILVPVGNAVTTWLVRQSESLLNTPLVVVSTVARYGLAILLLLLALSFVYHFGTSARTRWRFLTPGAVFCVAAWLLLGYLFRLYIMKFGKYNETYGTAGGIAIMLLIFYFDSALLLIGAEINSEVDRETNNVPPSKGAEPVLATTGEPGPPEKPA
jgi:membrane protein